MSATPALPEVLAISEKGNLDLQNLPDNGVKAFVSRIGEFVEDPDTMAVGDGIPYTVNFPWQTTIKTEPLCKVKWDQGNGIFDMTGDEYILEEPNPNAGSGPFDFPTS